MFPAVYADILQQEGFHLIGQLDYRVHATIWWNPAAEKRVEILVISIGRSALIKGHKSYYLKSVSPEGETWARDIGPLHDYLEDHFPELRMAFSHFRDVPAQLAELEVCRQMAVQAPTQSPPTVEQIALLQRQLKAKQQEVQATADLLSLSRTTSALLTNYVNDQKLSQQRQIEQLQDQLQRQQQRAVLLQHLQREYQQKGSAAAYTFAISSNLQVAADPQPFRDALQAVVKELTDLNRYQVTQKLGGRMNIQVAEAEEPAIAWIEQWFGGMLSPRQMQKLGPEFDVLRNPSNQHVMVTPDESIVSGDHVRHAEKHLAARVVSTVLQRLDKPTPSGHNGLLDSEKISPDAMPFFLGHRADEAGKMLGRAIFPLTQMTHAYVSGTTGGGKSYLARVLVEEAAKQQKLSILVLDPRNQSVGLLVPEDRPKILQQYAEFGMKPESARGFQFGYFAPALSCAPSLPKDLSSLARGRSIVSFKGMDDQERCSLAARILNAIFDVCSGQESEIPRLFVVVDEAQLFTRKRVDESAKEGVAQAERALDRIAREGRKFGIVLTLVSQTIKDFAYELASVRQMTTTKIFLRNSDREIEYAADIIGDGKLLVQLPTGTAIMHNANWGVVRLRVRPPCSKVFELGEAEIRNLVGIDRDPLKTITSEAQSLIAAIRKHFLASDEPLNMSQAADLAGITSKRRLLELIEELEHAGVIRTRKLSERGRPRVIELVSMVSRSAAASLE